MVPRSWSAPATLNLRKNEVFVNYDPLQSELAEKANIPGGTHASGKKVLSGGAVVDYQLGNNFPTDPNGILIESEPTGGYTGWQAPGVDLTPGDAWAVIAYAICVDVY